MKPTEKHDGLNDDQQTCDNSPEKTSWLIRNSAAAREQSELHIMTVGICNLLDVITVQHRCEIGTILLGLEGIDSFDVVDNTNDSAREDKNEGNQTESADNIKANK
jgi:hypothetical protein